MASLLPSPKMQFLDVNGDPLSGGKVNTYEAGTTTPKATYTTEAATVANANPVILDSRGEADIYWSTGAYKVVLTDSADTEIYTVDNVTLASTGATGASFLTGSGVPASGLGSDADSYLNTDNGDIYLKSSGTWSVTGNLNTTYTQQTVNDNDTQDITGLLFSSASIIEFNVKVVVLRGTARQVNFLRVLFTGSAWDYSESQVGDAGVTYAVNTSTAQVSYTSDSGVAGKLQWAVLDKTAIEA